LDYDFLKSCSQELRDKYVRAELGIEKCKIVDKYGLRCNSRLYWEKPQEKYPTQEYFSHKFARKSSPLGMVFHIYRLCFAKVKYFENNWEDFAPCKYDWKKGSFEECELYDMEFIKQKCTNITIDLRNLSKIHRVEEFRAICDYLENQKELINKTA
jgi:hypothetical protein